MTAPTQGLLDMYTIRHFKKDFRNLTVAIVGEVPLSRLWHAVPSYPTISEVWLRLLDQLR